jgi:hypothetical protein
MIYPSTVKGAPRRDEKTQLYEGGMSVIEERMSEFKLLWEAKYNSVIITKYLVEWAIALHDMYKSALFFEIGELTDSNLFALYCTITTIHPVN